MYKIAFLLPALALAACADPNTSAVGTRPSALADIDRVAVQAGLVDGLKDPSAAQLRNVLAYDLSNGQGRAICGEVNGKNALGGYVGFRPFYLRMKGKELVSMVVSTGAQDEYMSEHVARTCSSAATGRMMINGNL